MKYTTLLLLSILCLSSCAKISYQARDEFTPNGYSDLHIEGDSYRIIYETYKLKATEDLLIELAEYRAAELALEKHSAYFEIMSVNFTETMEAYDVPEQKITHTYGGGTTGGTFGSSITQPKFTEVTIIPAHVRQFKIKRVGMEIKISAVKTNDKAQFAHSIINERAFR